MFKEEEYITIHAHGSHDSGSCKQCILEKLMDLIQNKGEDKTDGVLVLFWRYSHSTKP